MRDRVARLYRSMRETAAGLPEVGESARALGVRPGIDVPMTDPTHLVNPGEGGMSVTPDDPRHLPARRRPPAFGGTGKDPVWWIDESDLGPDLCYRPDPARTWHGFVEPIRPMTLADYQTALAALRAVWRRA